MTMRMTINDEDEDDDDDNDDNNDDDDDEDDKHNVDNDHAEVDTRFQDVELQYTAFFSVKFQTYLVFQLMSFFIQKNQNNRTQALPAEIEI